MTPSISRAVAVLRTDRIVASDDGMVALGRLCLEQLGLDANGEQTIARWAGEWWRYSDGHHRLIDSEEMRCLVMGLLSRVDIARQRRDRSDSVPLNLTSRKVSEVIDAMITLADKVPNAADVPYRLPGYVGPDPATIAVVSNGLLETTPGRLHPRTPRLFATAGGAVDFDADAACPAWEAFIASIFTDDEGPDTESIRLIRQIFGWMISGDTTRHNIPLVIGPPRSGKSTMMAILRALLGEGNVCAPRLSSFAERFGLAQMIGRTAAIIPDARLSSRADASEVAELLNILSGQDTTSVERKNREAIQVRLRCRVVIVTNELPRIIDSSGALATRLIIVETRRSFADRQDLGLEARLRAELPGILNWSLRGWRDLVQNGWIRPQRAAAVVEEMDRLSSPIKAFVSDRLVIAPGHETDLAVLYTEFVNWCTEGGRREPGTRAIFARDLSAAFPHLKSHRSMVHGRKVTMYRGVGVGAP